MVDQGQGAGRDVNNNQHYTVLHLPEQKPESQLQSEFAKRTGIWCPKPAREWLEYLMEEHRFTAKELGIAWKAGSLGWNADKDERRIITPLIEAIFAYGIGIAITICSLAIVFNWIITPTETSMTSRLAVMAVACIYLGTFWMTNRFMIRPRHVALRVRKSMPPTISEQEN